MSFLSRIRSMLSPVPVPAPAPAQPAPDIALAEDGFVFGEHTIQWSNVARIRTYKLDFVTIDCVCLAFELDGGASVEVTEESNGFNDLTDELLERFPSIDADWYTTVMTPAFERNEAMLFDKAAS